MSDERRETGRDRSFARILIRVEGRVGYIADVSDFGFKGLFPEPFLEPLGSRLVVGVSFEELGLAAFELSTVLRWSRLAQGAGEVGFELVQGSSSEDDLVKFRKIRDYYSGGNLRST